MTIKELQKKVDDWISEHGVRYFNELTNLALLMEETGELARIMARTYGEQSNKQSEEHLQIADEIADIIFVLICIANQSGIKLDEAIEANLIKKTLRDRNRHLNNPKLGTKGT